MPALSAAAALSVAVFSVVISNRKREGPAGMLWDQLHPSVQFRRGGDEQRGRAMKQSVCN